MQISLKTVFGHNHYCYMVILVWTFYGSRAMHLYNIHKTSQKAHCAYPNANKNARISDSGSLYKYIMSYRFSDNTFHRITWLLVCDASSVITSSADFTYRVMCCAKETTALLIQLEGCADVARGCLIDEILLQNLYTEPTHAPRTACSRSASSSAKVACPTIYNIDEFMVRKRLLSPEQFRYTHFV